jgi:predicted dehydrogenase
MIQAALIGMGWWGKTIARAVLGKSKHLNFALGVSHELDDAEKFAAPYGLRVSNRFEDALTDPHIDAVVLATPHSLHARQCMAAAHAGKHVFCEKPLALNLADAQQVIATISATGLVLGIGQNKRFWPSMVKLREVVSSGALGQLMHLEGHYSNEHSSKFFAPWRDAASESPAGGLTGTGIHIVDAFAGIAGSAATVHTNVASWRTGADPRDATSVSIRFNNGITGYFAMVRASPFFFRVHAFGDQASVEAIGENEVVIRHRGGHVERHVFAAVDSVLAEMDAFAQAIPTPGNTPKPFPITHTEMLDAIGLFESIVQSVAAHNH